jgi:hypothetical protein
LVVKCSKRLFMRFFIGPGGATEWSWHTYVLGKTFGFESCGFLRKTWILLILGLKVRNNDIAVPNNYP